MLVPIHFTNVSFFFENIKRASADGCILEILNHGIFHVLEMMMHTTFRQIASSTFIASNISQKMRPYLDVFKVAVFPHYLCYCQLWVLKNPWFLLNMRFFNLAQVTHGTKCPTKNGLVCQKQSRWNSKLLSSHGRHRGIWVISIKS